MEASRSAIVAAALTLSAGLAGPAAATDLRDMSDPWLEPTYQWYGADAEWPDFVVAPRWPQPLPNNWIIGQVGGIAVDRHDNIWILQRARSLDNSEAGATDAYVDPATGEVATEENEEGEQVPIDALGNPRPFGPIAECCLPAPAVLKFDPEGNLLDAWGGPADAGYLGSEQCREEDGCVWPAGEHGIYVDHNDYVYIAGNGNGTGGFPWAADHGADGHVLKFTSDGTHVLTVGEPGPTEDEVPNSNDTDGGLNGTPQLYLPADSEVDPRTNELYIADGYGNHRVVVVDAETGQYKRHWGAYGQVPVDDVAADAVGPYGEDRDAGVLPPYFRNPVHCVRLTHDGQVYVCDRVEQPDPGLQDRRRVRRGEVHPSGHPAERVGLGSGHVDRPAAELPVQCGRQQPVRRYAAPREPAAAGHLRPPWSERGAVPLGAQPRDRLRGQHLHRGSRYR